MENINFNQQQPSKAKSKTLLIILLIVVSLALGYLVGRAHDYTFEQEINNNQITEENDNSTIVSSESEANTIIDGTCLANNNPFFASVVPSGGETYHAGQDITVRWTTCHMNENTLVGIMFTTINLGQGDTVVLSEGTINDEQETFIIPTSIGAQDYWMHVYEVDDPSNSIYSGQAISLQNGPTPSLTVTSPNGGEVLSLNSAVTVDWDSTNLPSNALVRVNLQQIESTQTHSFPLSSTTGIVNDGQEIFYIPSHVTANSNYKISISTDYLGGENYLSDESDSFFTLQ